MTENETLLAHLVPRLTSRNEDTATEALAFILRKSAACRSALDELLASADCPLQPLSRFQTQVQYEDGCKPDMVGYAAGGSTQLVVESKFWASLLPGQASGYIKHLDEEEPGVLLFVCPDARIDSLWPEVLRQMKENELEPLVPIGRARRAQVVGRNKRLMMVSWALLLDRMREATVPEESDVRSDIHQLRGLAQKQDDEAFQPLPPSELSPEFARRYRHLRRIVDTATARGRAEGWLSTKRLRKTLQDYGYGRYVSLRGTVGWLGLNHDVWGTYGHSPLWIWFRADNWPDDDDTADIFVAAEGASRWVPIYLKTGVEYEEVLEDVVAQLDRIGRLVSNPNAT